MNASMPLSNAVTPSQTMNGSVSSSSFTAPTVQQNVPSTLPEPINQTTPSSNTISNTVNAISEAKKQAFTTIPASTQPSVDAGVPAVSPKRGVRGVAIDLLPELSDSQVKKIEKKGKSNVFAVLLVLTVLALTVGVLVLNFLTKMELNMRQNQLAEEKKKIVSLQYLEMKQKTLVTKVNAYTAVREFDFSPDIVLTYLRDTASGLSTVYAINLNENLEFAISGSTDSYMNVARLWHTMASQEDYFEYITLDSVTRIESEDDSTTVRFIFAGRMNKENIDNI